MGKRIVARWQDESGRGLEHLELEIGSDGIAVGSTVLAEDEGHCFVVRYALRCDHRWRVRTARIEMAGEARVLELRSDGEGRWTDGAGVALPLLDGAIDIDITVTPFTNTLPIRRLDWTAGRAVNFRMAYVRLPEGTLTVSPQRYTCLEAGRRFRFESLDSDFARDLEIDGDGLVVAYPGLFRRVA